VKSDEQADSLPFAVFEGREFQLMLETPQPISNCGMDRQRLKNARVEISSMPPVSPETVLRKASFKVSKGFKVSGFPLKP
jgi:hypothetical protein